MNTNRKVMTLKHERLAGSTKVVTDKYGTHGELVKVDDREGKFLAWGVDYQELEGGPGMFSTAIVEFEDGSVDMVYPDLIRFIN